MVVKHCFLLLATRSPRTIFLLLTFHCFFMCKSPFLALSLGKLLLLHSLLRSLALNLLFHYLLQTLDFGRNLLRLLLLGLGGVGQILLALALLKLKRLLLVKLLRELGV